MTVKERSPEAKSPEAKSAGGKYYVYLLRCADGSYYCGSTNDPEKRLQAHNAGRGAKYTRGRGPCTMVYLEELSSRSEALSREWHLKKLTHREREMLVKGTDR